MQPTRRQGARSSDQGRSLSPREAPRRCRFFLIESAVVVQPNEALLLLSGAMNDAILPISSLTLETLPHRIIGGVMLPDPCAS